MQADHCGVSDMRPSRRAACRTMRISSLLRASACAGVDIRVPGSSAAGAIQASPPAPLAGAVLTASGCKSARRNRGM
eukprot:1194458-Prorocentrum_minimum.AAC.3